MEIEVSAGIVLIGVFMKIQSCLRMRHYVRAYRDHVSKKSSGSRSGSTIGNEEDAG